MKQRMKRYIITLIVSAVVTKIVNMLLDEEI